MYKFVFLVFVKYLIFIRLLIYLFTYLITYLIITYMDIDLCKKIGTREEVYKGLASRTAGGLCNCDIIEKNFNGKLIYISKKISDKMKIQMTAYNQVNQANQVNQVNKLDNIKQNTTQNTIQNTTQTTIQNTMQNTIQNKNKNKKIAKKNKKTLAVVNKNTTNLINKNKSKTQKLSFQINKNEIKNIYYPELEGIDIKELKEELLREEQEEDNCTESNDNDNKKVKKPLEPFKVEELPDIDINFL